MERRTLDDWGTEFRTLYDQMTQKATGLIRLSQATTDSVAERLRADQRSENTSRYIIAASGATLSVFITILLTGLCWHSVSSYYVLLKPIISKQQFYKLYPVLTFATLGSAAAIIFYTILIPITRLGVLVLRDNLFDVDTRSVHYWLFACIGNYLALPILFAVAANLFPNADQLIMGLLTAWLAVPSLALSLLVSVLVVAELRHNILKSRKGESPQRVVLELLRLVRNIDTKRDLITLTYGQRRRLVDDIVGLAHRIGRFYDGATDPATIWARGQMRMAAKNFLCLASWLYIPQDGTILCLHESLLRYLNIFLSGKLHELPRHEVDEQHGLCFPSARLKGWRRMAVQVGVACYLVLPVLGFAVVVGVWKVQVPQILQTTVALLYLIWVIGGLLSLADRLNTETRTFVTDIIKTIVGRR